MTDCARLAAIHAASFITPRPWGEAEIAEFLEEKFCYLIESAHGFAIGRAVAEEAELLTIAVAPEARGKGEGRALMAGFLDTSRARGVTTVFLEVAADNDPAITLYRNTGFVDVGTRKGYYHTPDGHRIDAKVMQMPLGQS